MSEKDTTNVLTGAFFVLCFITFTFITWLYFGGKDMADDSTCCKVVISGIAACIAFIVAFLLCNYFCKPKIEYISESSGIGISRNFHPSKYSKLEYYCFVDDSQKLTEGMFLGCKNLIMVQMPTRLKEIPKNSFAGCGKLSDMLIPDTVKTIREYAFLGCSSLVDLTIPESVEEIEKYAFANCRSLSKISIKSKDITIEPTTFQGCDSLKEIFTNGENVKDFYLKNKNCLNCFPNDCLIKQSNNDQGEKISELRNSETTKNNSREVK